MEDKITDDTSLSKDNIRLISHVNICIHESIYFFYCPNILHLFCIYLFLEVTIKIFLISLLSILMSSNVAYASFDVPFVYQRSLSPVFLVCSAEVCGSAVAISEDTLLTAYHVAKHTFVDEYDEDGSIIDTEGVPLTIYSMLSDDSIGTAIISRSDEDNDLAWLKSSVSLKSTLPILSGSLRVPMGSEVYVVGYPLRTNLKVTVGHYFGRMARDSRRFNVTAPVIFGNSGGPVLYKLGNQYYIIGIVSAISVTKDTPITHMGLIIPHTEIMKGMK